MARRRNMATGTVLLLAAATFAAGALLLRGMGSRSLDPKQPPRPVPPEPDPEEITIPDINLAMPTADDFPMGWAVHDEGGGAYPSRRAAFSYRVLKLNSPSSEVCQPEPCRWVLVFSGNGPLESMFGWSPHRTRDGAYDELKQSRSAIQRQPG